jgi:hypothetical protein
MWNGAAATQERYDQKLYALPRNTSAIQAISDLDGNTRLGIIVQLPDGAEVRVCGEGFNERTVKVAWEGGFYYIFREDLAFEDSMSRLRERTSGPVWTRAASRVD